MFMKATKNKKLGDNMNIENKFKEMGIGEVYMIDDKMISSEITENLVDFQFARLELIKDEDEDENEENMIIVSILTHQVRVKSFDEAEEVVYQGEMEATEMIDVLPEYNSHKQFKEDEILEALDYFLNL